MKRKFILALASVVLALGLGGLFLGSSTIRHGNLAGLNASLKGGAALEEAPVPVVGSSYDLSSHQTLSRVILLIKEHYVDPSRINPYQMFSAALRYIEKTVAEVTVDDTEAPKRVTISVGQARRTFDLEKVGGLDQLWEVTLALRDIFRFLQDQIADPQQRRDIEYAAISGMLSTLDPHSVLLKPESFDEVKLSTKGEFGGLGIVLSIRDGALTIIAPIEDTPAARAGLKAKDQIVRIGEESTVNMGLEDAVQMLRGKPGSKVTFWVLRKGWTEPRRFQLARAIIKIESVKSRLLADGVGYLRIKSFQANTYDDLDHHLEKLRSENKGPFKGLVLDLRDDPGGLLDQAILVSDRFIASGPIVITVGEGNKRRDVKWAHEAESETDYPIVVLVNGGSASASEIVSGALQNHNRALVLGQQTFGKGSVQVLYDFKDDSALKLTVAQYLTPGDVSIQSVGITPDVEIITASVSKDAVHLFVDGDAPREKDLEHHLEIPEAVRTDLVEPGADSHSPAAATGATQGSAEPRAAVRIVNLLPEEKPEAETGKPEPEEPEDTFKLDPEISLAHDILASATSLDRRKLLEQAMPLFRRRASEAEAQISERLATLGVDWSKVATPAGLSQTTLPELPPALDLQVAAGPTAPFVGGTTVTLAATLRNTGTAPLFRVYGVSHSDNPLFKNLEFVFGKLMPAESKRWEVKIKLPKDVVPRADEVKVELGDLSGRTHGLGSSTVVVMGEHPKPRFSFAYRIDDQSSGNGDGVLQVGEEVALKVGVRNHGPAEAEDLVVTAKGVDTKAVFLETGRDKLGALKAGATKTATLRFGVRAEADKINMRITMWDASFGEALSEVVTLPVDPPRKAKLERRLVRVQGQAAAPVYSGADDAMPLVGRANAGAYLREDATFGGEWIRVQADSDAPGFLRAKDVVAVAGGNRRPTPNALTLDAGQAAPVINLDVASLTTAESSVRLRGSVSDDRRLKDLLVFVNDKKVLYQSLASLQSGPSGVRTPFEVIVPLKDGSNAVAVIARENEDLAARKIFGFYRRPLGAVAERAEGRASRPAGH